MALLMGACTEADIDIDDSRQQQKEQMPVLFSVGNTDADVTRAAASASFMPKDSRFVCSMFFHAGANDDNDTEFYSETKELMEDVNMTTTWMKINNTVGNAVYWNSAYQDAVKTDSYGFDEAAKCFYWQNRLTHAFLALADYNKLTTNVGTTTNTDEDKGKLKMYPNFDKDFVTLPDNPTEEQQAAYEDKLSDNRYANTYDLTRGSTMTKMSDQPDPILALTVMKPAGATQEANRVRLYFRHQFSQIQVNIKGADDNSANITTDQIDGVELLGVAQEGYVSCRLNANGTVGPASAKDVILDDFSDDVLENNKWGTSFNMFDMATGTIEDGHDTGYATGFLKSYNAIAFGQLWAIRITWHEGTTSDPDIVHVSTFEVPATNETNVNLRDLASATKYVYDLELRRGTLAVIRTQVLDWMQKEELVYGTDGTITN